MPQDPRLKVLGIGKGLRKEGLRKSGYGRSTKVSGRKKTESRKVDQWKALRGGRKLGTRVSVVGRGLVGGGGEVWRGWGGGKIKQASEEGGL